jgi:hypothetical protein
MKPRRRPKPLHRSIVVEADSLASPVPPVEEPYRCLHCQGLAQRQPAPDRAPPESGEAPEGPVMSRIEIWPRPLALRLTRTSRTPHAARTHV